MQRYYFFRDFFISARIAHNPVPETTRAGALTWFRHLSLLSPVLPCGFCPSTRPAPPFSCASLQAFRPLPSALHVPLAPPSSAPSFGLPRAPSLGAVPAAFSEKGAPFRRGLAKSINFAAMEPKESPILQGLNPAQLAAVVNYDSPSLIIAGAGSGQDARADRAHRLYDRAGRGALQHPGAHLHQQGRPADARAHRADDPR